VAFSEGWFWYIPLSPTLTSVGAVVSRAAAEDIQRGKEEAFLRFVERCPMIREYLTGASRVSDGPYGELRIRKDYSYCNTSFFRDGLVLIGDAACFVDPVFSSGVHLATYSALLAARSINTCLRGTISEDPCFAEFEYRYRREYGNFYKFLAAFYDMHKDEASYFWAARAVLATKEPAHDAFVRLVAGLSGKDEPAFAGTKFIQTRDRLEGLFDKIVDKVNTRSRGPDSATAEVSGFDFDAVLPGLSTESSQIQAQAFLGRTRPAEAPLQRGGLTPSVDGLHWITKRSA
jgi:halogenation protein CepH